MDDYFLSFFVRLFNQNKEFVIHKAAVLVPYIKNFI